MPGLRRPTTKILSLARLSSELLPGSITGPIIMRRPEFGRIGDIGADETFPRDADHRERHVVHQDGAADDRGVGSETFLPATVTQHDDRVRFRGLIFLREKAATEKGRNAEDIEVIGGGHGAPDALVVAVVAQAGDGDAIGDQSGEDLVAIAVILVVEIRLEGVVGAVMERAVKFLELGSVPNGQGTERDGIDEAKDRGVGADAERHRDDGEKSKAGTLEKLARAVAKILEKRLHIRGFPDEMRAACNLDSKNVGGALAPRLGRSRMLVVGTQGPSHIKKHLLRGLLSRQRLLPIDHQLPRSDGVSLPDLKEMTRLRVPVATEGIFSVAVGEIGRGTHVTSQLFEGHLARLRAQQSARGILPHCWKTAFAVNAYFFSGDF